VLVLHTKRSIIKYIQQTPIYATSSTYLWLIIKKLLKTVYRWLKQGQTYQNGCFHRNYCTFKAQNLRIIHKNYAHNLQIMHIEFSIFWHGILTSLAIITHALLSLLDHASQQLVNFVFPWTTFATIGKQSRAFLPAAGGRVQAKQKQECVDFFKVRPDADHLVNNVLQTNYVHVTCIQSHKHTVEGHSRDLWTMHVSIVINV